MVVRLLLLFSTLATVGLFGQDIRFAPIPKEKIETVQKDYSPFLKWLEKQTGDKYTLVMSVDYKDLITKIEKGEVDIAYLGPIPFAKVKSEIGSVTPMVKFLDKNGNATYTCSIITRKESKLTSVKQLAGKKISLPQKLSTCGYYTAKVVFDENGMKLDKYSFDGNHENVALNVITGESEVGVLQTIFFEKYEQLGLKKIYETKNYPGFMLAANKKSLSDKKIEQIKRAILSLDPIHNKKDAQITKDWGVNIKYGAVEASENDYAEFLQNYKKMDALK